MKDGSVNMVIVLVIVVATIAVSYLGYKTYVANTFFGFSEFNKYSQLLSAMRKVEKFKVICQTDKDFCKSIFNYLDKNPNYSLQEKALSEHIMKYPQFIRVIQQDENLRKYCMDNWGDCIEVGRYLNHNSEKADKVYNSLNPGEALDNVSREVFSNRGK